MHRFRLHDADEAYRVADGGAAGNVCITFDDEVTGSPAARLPADR